MNQDYKEKLIQPRDSIGKTVELVVDTSTDVLIRFTDGSFIAIEASIEFDDVYLETNPHYISDDNLLHLGFVTEEELDEKRRLRDEEWKRQEKENRLKMYTELKKEFEA